ncbi:MAG: helix-turn-helix domain-containing protein, partial [Maribacter sp.]|nr:helix-turn-helix domain-containing protein [Maribacter sp.]
LSAAVFADKIKVQRSSISHLLSGRNKPSLEFVLKVIKAFPEVNLYWLLNGKGSFPPTTSQSKTIPPTIDPKIAKEEAPAIKAIKEKTIDKIIIFYSDGSFKSYEE